MDAQLSANLACELIRLARKFFPECKPYVSESQGLHWDPFLGAMAATKQGGYDASYDCWEPAESFGLKKFEGEPFCRSGVLEQSDEACFRGLLEIFGFRPRGRTLVIPDSFGPDPTFDSAHLPFICAFSNVETRLIEADPGFCRGSDDTIYIFESGEAFIIDHDWRVWWAKSRINTGLTRRR